MARATVTVAPSYAYAASLKHEPFWWPAGKVHFMGPLVEASRKGEQIPKLKATEAAKRYVDGWVPKKFITITIRNQDTDPSRNSNQEAWHRLKAEAESIGYSVVWMNEANDALMKGIAHAEIDPDLRLAIYERARMNFIGANGPSELLKFSEAPYRIVGIGLDGWAEHYKKYFHLNVGEQLPWAMSHQRMVYKPDSAEVLLREFREWHEASGSV